MERRGSKASTFQSVEEESDWGMDASIWVHQNIIKMSKEFGVEFEGSRKEALVLFKKISKKHPITQEAEKKSETPRIRGLQEVKGLALDMNFQSEGTRNKGRGISTDI